MVKAAPRRRAISQHFRESLSRHCGISACEALPGPEGGLACFNAANHLDDNKGDAAVESRYPQKPAAFLLSDEGE